MFHFIEGWYNTRRAQLPQRPAAPSTKEPSRDDSRVRQTGRRSAWNDNHRIRREGARNLVDAALHAGADRCIQESISFLYADGGDGYLDESAGVDPNWITEPALVAEAEAARFAEHGGVGIALRFGVFYGFDSAHTVEAIHAAQRGFFPIPGPADSYWPSVTTDDAASAVVVPGGGRHGRS